MLQTIAIDMHDRYVSDIIQSVIRVKSKLLLYHFRVSPVSAFLHVFIFSLLLFIKSD